MSVDVAAFIAGFRDGWTTMNMSIIVAAFIAGFFLGYLVRSVMSRRRRERVREMAWTGTWEWEAPVAQTSQKANRSTSQAPIAQTSHKVNRATAQAPIAETSHKATAQAPTATIKSLWTYWDPPPMKDHIPPTAP